MQERIAHRGPDDGGIYISENKKVGLTNRRLAVIDLSPRGHQPMCYKKRYWITYNGEIYNFFNEKKHLEKLGFRFRSNSDTEVILALYDKYGVNCLSHLRGMFAFAIYDSFKNTVFLARDRLGKKPLKYFQNRNTFIFASELKAILTLSDVHREPDFSAIHNYLTFGYVPSPQTGFTNICKLEPGHYLLLNLKNGEVKKKQYWKPDYNQKLILSEAEWCKKILNELEECTKLRMVSDVPVGAFLSGGVDSSAVVAMMTGLSKKPVKTFTIGFKEKSHDETKYADNIVKVFKTDHTEVIAKPESVEILPFLVRQFEEPYANSSFIVSYMVAKMAREKVTVVLNGDGGDENFAGYDSRHFRLNRDVTADKFGFLLNAFALPLAKLLGNGQIIRFLEKRKTPLADRYLSYNAYLENKDKELLYNDAFKNATKEENSYALVRNKFDRSMAADPRDRALYFDLTSDFPDNLLAKVDITSMMVSLEGRSPFADHKMVELAAQIPFDLKVKNGISKYILKKAVENIIPRENIYRPKMGFSVPLAKWFGDDLKKYTKAKLLKKDSFTGKLFDMEMISRLISLHSEINDMGSKLWPILTLELWYEEYFT